MTWELSEDSETSQGRKSGRTSFGHSQINLRKFLRKTVCFQGGQPTWFSEGISYRDEKIFYTTIAIWTAPLIRVTLWIISRAWLKLSLAVLLSWLTKRSGACDRTWGAVSRGHVWIVVHVPDDNNDKHLQRCKSDEKHRRRADCRARGGQ